MKFNKFVAVSAQNSLQHNKSANRYSINRIKPQNQKSKIVLKKNKNNSSFIDLKSNKQNQMNLQNSLLETEKSKKPSSRIYGEDDFIQNLHQNYKNSKDQYIAQTQKRYQSQLNEKDMIILEYKNNCRRLEFENKKKDKMIQQLQNELQIKERQMSNFQSQNISLNSAIDMMRNQQNQSLSNYQNLMNDCNNLKKQLMQKSVESKKNEQFLQKAHKDLQIYNSLQPRLRELEQLQDKLIQQNHKHKQEKEVLINTFKSINKIIKSSQKTIQTRQIQCLISGFLL